MSEQDLEQRSPAPDGRSAALQPAWREQFPIDVPRDNYVTRRDFTKLLGLTSLAFAAGQLWILLQSWLRSNRGQPPTKAIARLSQVPVGSALAFSYPNEDDGCLLLRLPDDATGTPRLLAYNRKCTHLSCAVIPDIERQRLDCPCHKGTFDLESGRPLAGPPRRPLARIQLEVRDNTVYATGVELRTV